MNPHRRRLLQSVGALGLVGPQLAWATAPSNFHAVYDHTSWRDAFFEFLQVVFHLYPQDQFHQIIIDLCALYPDDKTIYNALQVQLAGIKSAASDLTYGLPALSKQKRVMANQANLHLADLDRIDGYLEIGSTGRYVRGLKKREGPTWIVNDITPTNSPVDILERGQLSQVGTFVDLNDYAPISADVPDESVDVVANFIGFHHSEVANLGGFIDSIRRVLRPGGRLLVREHDVADPQMDRFVALAHDVFNAGVWLPWTDNRAQLRNFRSKEDWSILIEAAGFKRSDLVLAQQYDPTDNVLLSFERV
ncbi:MAG: methyltransferase domain-containing protein [Rhodobacterales bacterium]|nr:methyltransferase domain-containing protein [Rhodobacterales bacterium]